MDSFAAKSSGAAVGRSAIDPDARKLLWVLSVFNWTALLFLSKSAPLDYVAFYTAGRLIATGQRHHLFDYAAQSNIQIGTLGYPGILPFYHLAYEALIFAPLSLLSFAGSLWAWRLISCGVIGGSCLVLRRTFQLNFLDSLLLLLGFLSTATAFAQGQDSLVLLWLVAGALLSMIKKKDVLAGIFLALALFKPQLIIPIAIVSAWKRGGRFTGAFLMAAVFVLGISTLITGPAGWSQWQLLVRKAASGTSAEIGASANWMANLRGLAQLLCHDGRVVGLAVLVTSLAAVGITVWFLKASTSALYYFPPTIAMTLLVSYHSNIHDSVLLLIPIFALVKSGDRSIATQVCLGLCFAFPFFLAFGAVPYFAIVTIVLWILTIRAAKRPALTMEY